MRAQRSTKLVKVKARVKEPGHIKSWAVPVVDCLQPPAREDESACCCWVWGESAPRGWGTEATAGHLCHKPHAPTDASLRLPASALHREALNIHVFK